MTPTQAPSINAGTISLKGTLNVALLGYLTGFGASKTYKDVFVSDSPISGSFASVTTTVAALHGERHARRHDARTRSMLTWP